MRKPGRTRQDGIQPKSPIPLKLDTNAGFGQCMILAKKPGQKSRLRYSYSLEVRRTPYKNNHLTLIYAYLKETVMTSS